jgi:hypothetical protein
MTTLNSLSFNPYKPTRLKILSLGIGLSDDTNDSLRLTDDQRLLVAERLQSVGSNIVKTYGLIVDEQGIAVNTSIPDRADNRQQYALYVDGSVFVTGAVIACNVLSNVSGSGSNGDSFFKLNPFETDNIYYDGKITLGNQQNARRNAHALNIVKSADRNITNAQISLQNLDASQLRLGVIGTLPNAPVVFNTTAGTPMEFHSGRGQDYFAQKYQRSFFENGSNVTIEFGLPQYNNRTDAPHMLIDPAGNIGIHTSACPPLTYEKRIYQTSNIPLMIFPEVTEPMALHIDGAMFACNIIMYDFEEGKPQNIDRLFVRRKGVTFEANQVIPGEFAYGVYNFQSNLGIGGPAEGGWDLKVNGSARITDTLQVDNEAFVNLFTANDAILLDIASFCNDVYMNRDLILKESLRIRGGIYTEVIDGSNVYWCNVQFTVASPSYQNININGNGISTPGRMGVGIDPTFDEVNNMMVIRKNSANVDALFNFYELELMDRTNNKLLKTAYIGHPNMAADFTNDGSLVFATPNRNDANFNRGYTVAPQNFYFYPGAYTGYAEPFVTLDNPPTLNINNTGRIGVKTFFPTRELDIAGSMTFSGDIYQGTTKLAIWKDKTFPNINTWYPQYTDPTFRGVEYNNPDAPYVGVNSPPDVRYGMTVTGKLRSIDGFYTGDDRLVVPWMDSLTSCNVTATSNISGDGLFVMKPIGVGVPRPTAMVDVKNTFGDFTTLRLTRPERPIDPDSSFITKSRIEFAGVRRPWVIQADDFHRRLEFAHMASNALDSDTSERALWMRYDQLRNKHQTIIGGDIATTLTRSSNSQDALIVDGGITVLGDVTVTGKYRINATTLANSNIQGYSDIPLSVDDVFIGGNRIILNPNTTVGRNGFLGVGYTQAFLNDIGEETIQVPFRVFQANAAVPEIARFISSSTQNALIEIYNFSKSIGMKFGVYNGAFAFMDKNNNPFLNFGQNPDVLNERYISFNGSSPTAALHVQSENTGRNMLRLTRKGTTFDNTPFASELEFEKRVVAVLGGDDVKRWIVRGPDASFDQKLSFVYGETDDRTNDKEVITFTKNNCIGIGNTQPVFALDVASTSSDRGALRLWSSSSNPAPQLILQSGDTLYGADMETDYRIYAHSNQFYLDSTNQEEYKNLLHFNEFGHLGIGTTPTSNYQVNIDGVLNVTNAILLDGNPLFDTGGSDAQSGFFLRAINIYVKPQPEFQGGVVINGTRPTTNIFHVFAGNDANMMVLDSPFSEAQVHFRATTATDSLNFNMYRMGLSNQKFMWKHMPNSSNAYAVPGASNAGYCNVIQWGPSSRVDVAGQCNYDVDIFGSANLVSAYPQIRMGPSPMINTVIGNTPTTHHLFMLSHSGNVGFGTTLPLAATHVYANNTGHAFRVNQVGTGDIMRFVSGGVDRLRVTNSGRMGLGTTNPTELLHVEGGNVRIAGSGTTLYTPSMYFTNSITTGLANPSTDVLTIQTAGTERIRVMANGNVGIGTTLAVAPFHVYAANTDTSTTITQAGTGDILRVASSVSNVLVVNTAGRVGVNTSAPTVGSALDVVGNVMIAGHVTPSSHLGYDLGSSNARWRDLYLSGNTLDLGGTKITRDSNTGYVQLRDGTINTNPLVGVVVDSVFLPDISGSNLVALRYNSLGTDPFVYVASNVFTGAKTEYTPFAKSDTSGGISVGVLESEALLHIANSSNYQPTAIFEQTSGVLSDVLQIRGSNQQKLLQVQNDGNVGIGTTIAHFPLHVMNMTETSVVTVQQNGSGDILRLKNAAGTQVNITAGGTVGIGTTIPQATLHNHGTTLFDDTATFQQYVYMAGDLEVQGNTITHGDTTTDSDIRLKADLLRITNALDKVSHLTGYTFTKIKSNHRSTGLIAQDVQKVLPEAVYERTENEGKTLGVAYGNMMGLIVEAIKELKADVQYLKDIVMKK